MLIQMKLALPSIDWYDDKPMSKMHHFMGFSMAAKEISKANAKVS